MVSKESVFVQSMFNSCRANPGTVFSHFLVQILHKAPLQRLEAWLFRALSFDLTCVSGIRLVASLPGEHLPARALQANQVVLRLSLEAEEWEEWEDSGMSNFVLKTSDTLSGTWCLSREGSEPSDPFVRLDEMSLTALRAAAHFNFNAYSGETEVSLSTRGPLSINVEVTRFSSISDVEGSPPVTKLRVLLKATEATHLDIAEVSHENLVELANFLALLEVDYGLFALQPAGSGI